MCYCFTKGYTILQHYISVCVMISYSLQEAIRWHKSGVEGATGAALAVPLSKLVRLRRSTTLNENLWLFKYSTCTGGWGACTSYTCSVISIISIVLI